MSMKSRLFASVAGSVLSLPLLLQPATAMPIAPTVAPQLPAAMKLVQVQQQLIIPPEGGAEAEEGERPRRREQQAEEPQGERPQRRERQAEEGEGGERPSRRQQQAEQPEGEQRQGERPQRREQRAEEPQAERPPRAEQQAEQPAEQPEGERPKRRQQQAEQPVEQPAEKPAEQNAEQAPEAETPRRPERAEKPAAEQPAAEQPKSEQPAERPQRAERPAEKPAEKPKAERPQRAQEGEAPRRDGQAAEGGAPAKPRPERARDQAAEPAAPDAPQQSSGEQPVGERPAEGNAADPALEPAPDQAGTRPAVVPEAPRTPEQVERARDVARDPSKARDGEQVVLPVENGAAVLDSAKEQRPDRPRRDGSRDGTRDGERPRGGPDRQADQRPAAPPPKNDAEAQANDTITREQREQWRNQRQELVEERGERMDRRPEFERPRGWDVRGPARGERGGDRDRDGGRVIISIDNQTVVRGNDSRRFYRDGGRPEYERLGDGRYREIVERPDGTRVVTVRNRYGEVVQRSRVVRGGEEYVLYYAPELLEDRSDDYVWRDPGDDLPPMRLTVPVDEYIIDTSSEPDRDYYEFLEQPPVERVERPYSLDEVRYSARIRDKVPRIDLDTVTFATGSAEIPMNQASSLRKVADAINQVLEKDPSETFLIEGHTDAVGSDESNLVLSDERAESVAVVLADAFGIPPENLTTQGYGERYLKVRTEAANQENRRVTIRRITPLVKPVASNQ